MNNTTLLQGSSKNVLASIIFISLTTLMLLNCLNIKGQYPNEHSFYVKKAFSLIDISADTKPIGYIGEINTDKDPLTVRMAPQQISKAIGVLQKGENVYIIKEISINGEIWGRINYDNNTGYVSTDYIKQNYDIETLDNTTVYILPNEHCYHFANYCDYAKDRIDIISSPLKKAVVDGNRACKDCFRTTMEISITRNTHFYEEQPILEDLLSYDQEVYIGKDPYYHAVDGCSEIHGYARATTLDKALEYEKTSCPECSEFFWEMFESSDGYDDYSEYEDDEYYHDFDDEYDEYYEDDYYDLDW